MGRGAVSTGRRSAPTILENRRFILAIRDFLFNETLHLGFSAQSMWDTDSAGNTAALALHFIAQSFQGRLGGESPNASDAAIRKAATAPKQKR